MKRARLSGTTFKLIAAALIAIAAGGAIPIVAAIDAAETQIVDRIMQRIEHNMRLAWHLIHDFGPVGRIDAGALYFGARKLNGDARLVDEMVALAGGAITVFQDDVRIASTVRTANGLPAIGTRLEPGPAYDTVVRQHRSFRGRATVLGTDYYAAYDPILDETGREIGILFVGVKAADVMAGMAHLRMTAGTAGLGAVLLVGLIFLAFGHALSRRLVEREQTLQDTNAQLAIALDSMANGLCLWNAERRLVITNRRAAELLGMSGDLLRPGIEFRDFVALRHARGHYGDRDLDAVYDERIVNLSRPDPLPHLEHFTDGRVISVVLRLIEGGGWLTTYEDVTERHRAGTQIAHLAHHDALTGLANRTLFNNRIATALAQEHALALLCIDLDGFKSVNDTLGHPAGDALLRLVAARLQQCCRAGDTVARLGGDEFAIVLAPLPRAEDASHVAERILHAVAAPYDLDGTPAEIGVSVGVVISEPGARETEILLKHADVALYQAKSAGGNTFRVFDAGMDDARRVRRALEGELRRALAEEEFVLFYQPQIEIQSGAVCGFEALIRWRHPSRGLLGPGEFVPAAEAAGLIAPIGAWVLHQACADAARWAFSWPDPVRVAVNLSAMQFRDPDLVATVHAALLLGGLPPHLLELEITETLALHEVDQAASVLNQLRALGISISLDDFGTGYSSLSFVRRFPLDRIKIDRSFVDGIGTRADSVAIIRSVSGLAHSLGIATVAEGVETEAQLRWLADEGCDEVQGYLFSRPRPVDAVPEMLRYRDARRIAQHAAAD